MLICLGYFVPVPRFAGKWSSGGSASCTSYAAGSNTTHPRHSALEGLPYMPTLPHLVLVWTDLLLTVLLIVEAHYIYYHADMLGLSPPAAAVHAFQEPVG